MLDLRSVAEDTVLGGARESDILFAVPDRLDFLLSSPELATDRPFSSAELLIDTLDLWLDVVVPVDVVPGFRTVEVVGRVGGLLSVLLPLVRVADVDVGFAVEVEVDPAGRRVVPATGRFVEIVVLLRGEALALVFGVSGVGLGSSSVSTPASAAGSSGWSSSTVARSSAAGGAVSSALASAGSAGSAGSAVSAGWAVSTGSTGSVSSAEASMVSSAGVTSSCSSCAASTATTGSSTVAMI